MTSRARRSPRVRPIHLALTLLLAFAGVFAVTAPAEAATDTIEGTVTGPAGTAGIAVYLSQELSSPQGSLFTGPGSRSTLTDSDGYYAFTSVPIGDYYLLVDHGDSWVQDFSLVEVDGSELTPKLVALRPGKLLAGTVRDAVAATTLPDVSVTASGEDPAGFFLDWLTFVVDINAGLAGPVTGSDGSYRIVVPLGNTYVLDATDQPGDYLPQTWDHRSGCSCVYDVVEISPTGVLDPAAPYDFDLIPYDAMIDVSVYAERWDGADFAGVDVILEKLSSGSWELFDQGVTDSDGLVDLIGGGDGQYRLRYSIGGVTGIVTQAVASPCGCAGSGTYLLAAGGRQTLLGTLIALEYYPVDLTFKKPASGGGGGGGTPPAAGPAATPRSDRGTAATPNATPTPEPTATPTPSSTPTTQPTGEPEPRPSASATPAPDPAAGSADLPWWVWLLIALLVLGIIVTIVAIVRRR